MRQDGNLVRALPERRDTVRISVIARNTDLDGPKWFANSKPPGSRRPARGDAPFSQPNRSASQRSTASTAQLTFTKE
jgi:hypothetical protein